MIHFKRFEDCYRNQVIELLNILWRIPDQLADQYFSWKYELNPYSKSPLCFIALDDEKVISFTGYMPQPVRIENNNFLLPVWGDSVTHPAYRGQGLYQKVPLFSYEYFKMHPSYPFIFTASAGEHVIKYVLKLGFIPLAERDNIFYLNIPQLAAKQQRANSNYDYLPVNKHLNNKTILTITRDCDIRQIADLSMRTTDFSKFAIVQDEKYYSWRLANPRGHYFYGIVTQDGHYKAFMILKEFKPKEFDIIDFVTSDKVFIKKLIKHFRRIIHPKFLRVWKVSENVLTINKAYYYFFSFDFIKKKLMKLHTPPVVIRQSGPLQVEDKWVINTLDARNRLNWKLNRIISDEV